MVSWLPFAVFLGVFLAMEVAGLIINRRIGRSLAPRSARKRYRWAILNQAVLVGMLACLLLSQRLIEWHTALLLGVMVVSMAPLVWLAVKRQTEDDAQRNFAQDTGHCGRCEYDLTGNVSGICPECGWEIPRMPMRLQSPNWARWWRKWEIEYLENWPRTLRGMRLGSLIFAFLAIVGCLSLRLGVLRPEPLWFTMLLSLPFWLIAGHMLILSIRVAAYGRKHGNERADQRQGPDRETSEQSLSERQ